MQITEALQKQVQEISACRNPIPQLITSVYLNDHSYHIGTTEPTCLNSIMR